MTMRINSTMLYQFAELLNRIRVGQHTKEDIATLRTRVRQKTIQP
jgi:hypothetical protein